MGQALYRRYRSTNLAEIVGQDHITTTLQNTLKKGAFGHAYLLTGPRGVGKTSIARILAHEINELPYESEKIHLDIIEIDAASNRRIDEIRDLRDKVHTAPSSAKYKVYIIDEVHMLTKEAFNALLKTLEEPPKHVIFILATTDVHKLPETIISRTQHFTFKPIPDKLAAKHLEDIAKKEKITIEPEALVLLAKHGKGSFRDSIGLLEQASNISKTVTAEEVRTMLGVPPKEKIEELASALSSASAKSLLASLDELLTNGYIAEEIASQLAALLRQQLIDGSHSKNTSTLLKELLAVPSSADPTSLLEITLLTNIEKPTTTQLTRVVVPPPIVEAPKKPLKKETETKKVEPTPKNTNTQNRAVDEDTWPQVLNRIKATHSTLYSIARMAVCTHKDNEVLLVCDFPFHKKRLDTDKHKTVLRDAFEATSGVAPVIHVAIAEKRQKKTDSEPPKPKKPEPSETISNIFGGAEVLES